MIVGILKDPTKLVENMTAEHYLFSARRHAERIEAARKAVRTANRRYLAAIRRRNADRKRCIEQDVDVER